MKKDIKKFDIFFIVVYNKEKIIGETNDRKRKVSEST